MDLSIIIVNYKTKEVTADCLRTIQKSDDKLKKEVIVVDNDSQDGSFEYLRKKFPKFTVVDGNKNGGFAYGNNFGVKKARGKYVWLLNSDTLLKKDTIRKLMELVSENESEIASCKLLNRDGSIQPQGGYLPFLRNVVAWMLFLDDIPLIKKLFKPYQQSDKGFFRKNRHPGWFGGTALLVKRDLYNKLGGLDEKIFMYGEDVDFCMRASKLGVRLDYYAEPELTHLGQASGSSRGAVLGEYKGIKYVFNKHKPTWEMPVLRILLKMGAALRILLFGYIFSDENRKEIYKEAFKLA